MVEAALIDKSKFLSDQGHYILRGIFWEWALADKSGCVYTLKQEDHNGFPSLYRLYMECDDLTEYTFATQYLYNWEHWTRLCKASWFKEYITAWRAELEVRTRARALQNLRAISADPSHKAAAAVNRYLVDGGWKSQEEKKGRGRPSKDQIKSEAEKIARDARDTDEEFKRITGLN